MLVDAAAGALQKAGEMFARADAEADQDQSGKQRDQRLLAGQHHDRCLTQLAESIE